jgi:hypothetical protein
MLSELIRRQIGRLLDETGAALAGRDGDWTRVSSPLRQLVEGSADAVLFNELREMELDGVSGTRSIDAVQVT